VTVDKQSWTNDVLMPTARAVRKLASLKFSAL
jgi:hypothetical protein